MNLATITNAISNLTFHEYQTEEVKSIIMLPENVTTKDPLVVTNKNRNVGVKPTPKDENKSNGFLNAFIHKFFQRFNKDIPRDRFLIEFKEFRRVFLNELRAGALKNWKYSTFRKNKDKVLQAIEGGRLDYYLLQWIADYYDILVVVKDKEYIPRKDKQDKPIVYL